MPSFIQQLVRFSIALHNQSLVVLQIKESACATLFLPADSTRTLFGMDDDQDGLSNVNICPGPHEGNNFNPGGATFYNIYGVKTRAGNTWDQIQLWLNGATEPTSCSLNSTTNIYQCTITRTNPTGYVGLMVWHTQSAVFAVQQAPNGFLWLTTATGVYRFDGMRFESTDEVTNREAHNASIVTVFPSSSGGVWLTTRTHGLLLTKRTMDHV